MNDSIFTEQDLRNAVAPSSLKKEEKKVVEKSVTTSAKNVTSDKSKSDTPKSIRPKVKLKVLKEFFSEGGIYQGPSLDVLIRFAEETGDVKSIAPSDAKIINKYLDWGYDAMGKPSQLEACTHRAIRAQDLMDTISSYFSVEQYNRTYKMMTSLVHDVEAISKFIAEH